MAIGRGQGNTVLGFTKPEFIESMKKFPQETRFALRVKDTMDEPVEFNVPIGKFDRQSKMTDREYKKFLEVNRARICAPVDRNLIAASQAVQSSGATFEIEEQTAL